MRMAQALTAVEADDGWSAVTSAARVRRPWQSGCPRQRWLGGGEAHMGCGAPQQHPPVACLK